MAVRVVVGHQHSDLDRVGLGQPASSFALAGSESRASSYLKNALLLGVVHDNLALAVGVEPRQDSPFVLFLAATAETRRQARVIGAS